MSFSKAALLLAVLGLAAHTAQAQRLIVFGDGLADDGDGARLYARNVTNNQAFVYPPTPYYMGRFTNGPVIPEYLAQYLNLTLYNFAIDGATSGATPSFFVIQNDTAGLPANFATPRNIGIPSVYSQVTNYVNLTRGSISANDYYCLFVGQNDYFDILAGANATVTNVVNYIQMSATALYQAGVRKIVISEVPPLQASPFAGTQSATVKTQLTNLVQQHNANLSTMVRNLSSTYPQGVFAIVPTYTIVSNIAANPTQYGFTNATSQCYGTASQAVPAGTGSLCTDPAAHIFWDRLNPTTKVHQLIAATAAKEVATTAGITAMAPAGLAPVPAPAGLIAG